MDAYLDGLLDELVTAEPREAWGDVLRRTRRSRRRYAAVVSVVGALALAPAAWAAVNAFEGTPAPATVVQSFVGWDARTQALAAAGLAAKAPIADATKVRGVLQAQTSDGPLDLWAAPASDGGTCMFAGWASDLDAPNGAMGSSMCVSASPPSSNFGWAQASDLPEHPSYSDIFGYAYGDAATVDATLADGNTTRLPVVEHCFLGVFANGATIVSLVSRDSSGGIVSSWSPPGPG